MKKTFALVALGALVGSTSALAANHFFSDVAENAWYSDSVNELSEIGIIQGYPDGTFKPGNSVNRAELAVIIDRLIEYIETGEVERDIYAQAGLFDDCPGLEAYEDEDFFDELIADAGLELDGEFFNPPQYVYRVAGEETYMVTDACHSEELNRTIILALGEFELDGQKFRVIDHKLTGRDANHIVWDVDTLEAPREFGLREGKIVPLIDTFDHNCNVEPRPDCDEYAVRTFDYNLETETISEV